MRKIQDLIEQRKKYLESKWLSVSFFDKLYQYLFLQRPTNLAPALINAIINSGAIVDEGDCATLAQIFVDSKISFPYLISQMQHKSISFNAKSYKLLEELEKCYIIKQPQLSKDDWQSRVAQIMALPLKLDLTRDQDFTNHQGIKDYINNPQSSLLVINALLNTVHGDKDYSKTILALVRNNTTHATNIAILAYDILQRYRLQYYDKSIVEKHDVLNEFSPTFDHQNIIGHHKSQKIKEWIDRNDEETPPWFAWFRGYKPLEERIFDALSYNKLVNSGYEKSIVKYIAEASPEKKDEAIRYAISRARQKIIINTDANLKTISNLLPNNDKRNQAQEKLNLLEALQTRLQDIGKKIGILSDTSSDTGVLDLIKNIVVHIESNPRLLRIFKGAIMNKLHQKQKQKNAAGILIGQDSIQNIAKVMLSPINSDLLNHLLSLMGGTIADIEAKYNLEPGYLSAMSRGWNQLKAYPEWLFFFILDSITVILEYIYEYVIRGLYWVYDGIRQTPDENKRKSKSILHQDDIETVIESLIDVATKVHSIETKIELTDKDKLKNAIITYFSDDNNDSAITTVINTLETEKNISDELKEVINKIKPDDKDKYDKNTLYQFLNSYEMQNVSTFTSMTESQAQVIALLNLCK